MAYVKWTTIHLMLIQEVLFQLKSKEGNVIAAFLHADLEKKEKGYVKMLLGFWTKGKVLKLKKILYGLRQSPCAFWKFLTKAMIGAGMRVSKSDPCLFSARR